MATITVFATGDEIATYETPSMSGNRNGVKVTLDGVRTLGSATDVFRIEVTQVNNGADFFSTGNSSRFLRIPTQPTRPFLLSSTSTRSMTNFRAARLRAIIRFSPSLSKSFSTLMGTTSDLIQYGPGLDLPRDETVKFAAFSSNPPSFPCFAEGTLIETATGPRTIEVLRRGDLVKTRDRGPQPIVWAGHARVDGTERETQHPCVFPPALWATGATFMYRRSIASCAATPVQNSISAIPNALSPSSI